MKCPKCEGTERLSRNELVCCNVHIKVHSNGRWEWVGDSDVHWETSDYRGDLQGEPEWRCKDCDISFDAPDVKPGDEGEVQDES
jgi:hypothetical protein